MTARLYTTEEAAAELGIEAALIRKWRHRGRALPAGMLPAPVPGGLTPLWTMAELRPLVDAYRQRKRQKVT